MIDVNNLITCRNGTSTEMSNWRRNTHLPETNQKQA